MLHVPAKWGALQTSTQYWAGRQVEAARAGRSGEGWRGVRNDRKEGRAKTETDTGRTERARNFIMRIVRLGNL